MQNAFRSGTTRGLDRASGLQAGGYGFSNRIVIVSPDLSVTEWLLNVWN